MPKRNLFLTKTALGVYISLIGLFTAVSPNIEALLSRGKTDTEKMNIRDWFAIVVGTTGAASTLLGRYLAGGCYTPKGVIGADPPERLQ
jgi:hypothetical protein